MKCWSLFYATIVNNTRLVVLCMQLFLVAVRCYSFSKYSKCGGVKQFWLLHETRILMILIIFSLVKSLFIKAVRNWLVQVFSFWSFLMQGLCHGESNIVYYTLGWSWPLMEIEFVGSLFWDQSFFLILATLLHQIPVCQLLGLGKG